ncbi:hypothetical protein [Vreelandella lionensis]|uniref:hypothetical protein n=1 Tax=Vreelandella lionensis TaxID=1144478 RepID=UPI0009F5A72E
MTTFNAHPDVFAFSLRFLYGLRMAGAVTIGTTDYPWPRFILLNAISALLWSAAWVTLGYMFGQALAPLFERLMRPFPFCVGGCCRCPLHRGSGRDGFQAETNSALNDARLSLMPPPEAALPLRL